MENWFKIKKKGQTYLVEKGTLKQFKVKYNQDSYRIGSNTSDDVKGYVLTNYEGDFWFITEEFFMQNYVFDDRLTFHKIDEIED